MATNNVENPVIPTWLKAVLAATQANQLAVSPPAVEMTDTASQDVETQEIPEIEEDEPSEVILEKFHRVKIPHFSQAN